MSQRITLKKWAGNDLEDSTRRLAKAFRMSPIRASSILDDLSAGKEWLFEYTISDEQATLAQSHLEKLGFTVTLELADPSELLPKEPKTTSIDKEPSIVIPESRLDNVSSLQKPFNKWVGQLEERAGPMIKENFPQPDDSQRAEERKFSFFDNLLRRQKTKKSSEVSLLPRAPSRKSWFGYMGKKLEFPIAELDEPYKKGFSEIETKTSTTRPKARSSKLLFILLILFFLGVGGAPYWAGIQIESRFNRLSALFSANQLFQWIHYGFDRGIFHSTAETGIRILGFPLEIKMTHDISHGPLLIHDFMQGDPQEHLKQVLEEGAQAYMALASAKTRIHFRPPLSPYLQPLMIQTRVSFERNIDSRYWMKGVELQVPVSLNWAGLKGETHFPPTRNAFQGNFQILPASVGFEGVRAILEGMPIVFNLKWEPAKFWQVNSKLDINRIILEDLKEPLILDKIQIRVDSDEQQGLAKSTTRIKIGKLKIGNSVFGPGHLTGHARNVDTSAIMKLQQLADLIGKARDPQTQQEVFAVLNDIVKRSPEIEISEIQFSYPEGILKGEAKLRIEGSQIDLVKNPLSILDALQVNASVNAPRIVFEREYKIKDTNNPSAPPMKIQFPVQAWLKRGSLTTEGDNYKTDIAFQKGQLIVNGKPFNPLVQ